jgi:hypothetical protein
VSEPTGDQSWCDVGRHQSCDGWCLNHRDPELCGCPCHDESDPARSRQGGDDA